MSHNSLYKEMGEQLIEILDYWTNNTIDDVHGGFVGAIDHQNNVIQKSPKGIILNTRILWSFSAASRHLDSNYYTPLADRAFQYLKNNFFDLKYGGVYWELDYEGNPIDKRKQIYAQAFAIYSLSEYYLLSKKEEAKQLAIDLFNLIEKHAYDHLHKGYLDARSVNWASISDSRLSVKDLNAEKTMNTHLHLLEAYTTLLEIHQNSDVEKALKNLIYLMQSKFLNSENHYELFFDLKWKLMGKKVSFGHDIEAAWLIIDAATLLKDEELIQLAKNSAIKVAETFLKEAIDSEGAVMNEKDLSSNIIDNDRHWWPQAEAIIGLHKLYKLTKQEYYLTNAVRVWNFTKNHMIDYKNGEWYFRIDQNGDVYTQEDKVSMWKAPYHNSRACMKINS